MAKAGQRKCLCCNTFFIYDPRNRERQRYCSNAICRLASKSASQAKWLTKSQNMNYFCGPVHVKRVQAWRRAHPDYRRARPTQAAKSVALQDASILQVTNIIEESTIHAEITEFNGVRALQDLLNPPTPVLAGLIAHIFDVTLQEDITLATRRLVQMGHDLINRSPHEDRQTRATP